MNLIVSMLVIDLDVDFQTRTPNQTTDILSPGPLPVPLTADVYGDPPTFTQQGKAFLDESLNQPLYLIPSENSQRPRLVTQTLIQDVYILHVGDFIEAPPQQTEEGEAPAAPGYPSNITIIVSPQDAVTLNYLMLTGAQLSLALRPPNDDSQFISEAVTLDYLFSRYAIPLPSRLPYGLEPRVDGLILPKPVYSPSNQ